MNPAKIFLWSFSILEWTALLLYFRSIDREHQLWLYSKQLAAQYTEMRKTILHDWIFNDGIGNE